MKIPTWMIEQNKKWTLRATAQVNGHAKFSKTAAGHHLRFVQPEVRHSIRRSRKPYPKRTKHEMDRDSDEPLQSFYRHSNFSKMRGRSLVGRQCRPYIYIGCIARNNGPPRHPVL